MQQKLSDNKDYGLCWQSSGNWWEKNLMLSRMKLRRFTREGIGI